MTASPATAAAPPLSAVAATTQLWPEARPLLESIRARIAAVGGEIVLGDGSTGGLPDEVRARLPCLRVIHRPGAGVFQLRAVSWSAPCDSPHASSCRRCSSRAHVALVFSRWQTEIRRAFHASVRTQDL